MNAQDKLKMFDQVRYDLVMADGFAYELAHRGGGIQPDDASELLRRCVKANASAQAYESAMRGIEPPKAG